MTVEERILEQPQTMTPEDRERSYAVLKLLSRQRERREPLISSAGILKGLRDDISFEEFQALRKETWGNYPRDLDCCAACQCLEEIPKYVTDIPPEYRK